MWLVLMLLPGWNTLLHTFSLSLGVDEGEEEEEAAEGEEGGDVPSMEMDGDLIRYSLLWPFAFGIAIASLPLL